MGLPMPFAVADPLGSLPRIATPVRELNARLWSLLTKPDRLTAEEWAYVEECERNA